MNIKHTWQYKEDLYCCESYYEYFVVRKSRISIDEFVKELSIELPEIKTNSMKMKVQNIKQILMVLNIEDTLRCTGLANYSRQNFLAMEEAIKNNRIDSENIIKF